MTFNYRGKFTSMVELGAEMGVAFKGALKENYQAAKRVVKRQTGIVGFGQKAAESYKKDGSVRNAVKVAVNNCIDNTADNLKDIYGIAINSPTLKAGEVVSNRIKTNLKAAEKAFLNS